MKPYKVGVVIPVYEGLELLPRLLSSLHTQTEKDFVVCIASDADTVDYSELIEEYQMRGLDILFERRTENGGPGMARQTGLDTIANLAEYVMFADQDDVLMPYAIQIMYNAAIMNKSDIVSATFIEETEHGLILRQASSTPATWVHGKLYNIEYLQKYNIRFTSQIYYNEDCYFNVVAMNCTYNITRLDELPVYYWSYNANSVTHTDIKAFMFKAWRSFVTSQVLAILKILEVAPDKLNPGFVAVTLTKAIYAHLMLMQTHGIDTSSADEDLRKLNVPELRKIFQLPSFWHEACIIAQGIDTESGPYFPSENFHTWLRTHILGGAE